MDVRVRREHWDSQAQSVEYVISGTAVRLRDGSHPPAEPAVVALAMDDYWKLLQAGYEPVGIAAASVVYETAPSVDAVRALAGMRYAEGRATREVPEFSDTVSGTIELALARAGEGAQRWRADHIVGVRIERKLEVVDRENTGRMPLTREPAKRRDLKSHRASARERYPRSRLRARPRTHRARHMARDRSSAGAEQAGHRVERHRSALPAAGFTQLTCHPRRTSAARQAPSLHRR